MVTVVLESHVVGLGRGVTDGLEKGEMVVSQETIAIKQRGSGPQWWQQTWRRKGSSLNSVIHSPDVY